MPTKGSAVSPINRVTARYTVNEVTGCWEWQGSHSSQGGYPTIGATLSDGSHTVLYVHRVVWEEEHGPINEGPCHDGSDRFEIHHRCMNRSCVNVHHMELLTRREHSAAHKLEHDRIRSARVPLARRPPQTVSVLTPDAVTA